MIKRTAVKEYIEWSNMRWNDAVAPGKKRLLLIGDSIVAGHCEPLFDKLKGNWCVDMIAGSRCVSDVNYRTELDYMLKLNSYAIIVFNNGLHGFEVPDDVYLNFLRETMKFLKTKTPKLFWRNSTPMLEVGNHSELHHEYGSRIAFRNAGAAHCATDLDIAIIDMYRPMLLNRINFLGDGVHYNAAGQRQQADILLASLRTFMA